MSIDTEPRIGKSIDKYPDVLPQGGNALYGVEFIVETMKRYHQKSLFFIEALHYHYFGTSLLDYLKPFIQHETIEVGLHIHPAWRFFKNNLRISDQSADLDAETLTLCIQEGMDFLQKFIPDKKIRYFRSGNLSAGNNLFKALHHCGFKHVSTSSLAYGTSTSRYHGAYETHEMIDIPVTTFYRHPLKNQIFSITGVSRFETQFLLRQAYDLGLEYVMIITHPFEFIDKDKKNISANQNRLKSLCQFVQDNSDKFEFDNDLSLVKPTQDTILKSPLRHSIPSMLATKLHEFY